MRLAGVVRVRLAAPPVRLSVWRKHAPAATLGRVKVLIVDDHPSFRASARRMLEADGFEVVAEAGSGSEALQAAETWDPDLVLLDVHLPDVQGFEVAARLSADDPAPAIVLTSSRDGSDFGPLVERSGARGFVPKSDLSGEAVRRIVHDRS